MLKLHRFASPSLKRLSGEHPCGLRGASALNAVQTAADYKYKNKLFCVS
jgi:hypothetical protein